MRHVIVLLAGLTFMLMVGCASLNPFPKSVYSTPPSKQSSPATKGYDPKIKPYRVLGKKYYPLSSAEGYDEVGLASWYGKDFHGKKTANGQIYNMYGVSAAHKTLPLGTRVRVTNLANNQSVVLVINDRGPFVHGRVIDLSYGAAKKLGTVERGVAKVRISAIGSVPGAQTASSAIKYYHVRVGAFSIRSNAERMHGRLVSNGFKDASIATIDRSGATLYVVQAGSFTSRGKAESVLESLKEDFPTSYIIS